MTGSVERETGSGSVLVVGILGALTALVMLAAPLAAARLDSAVAASAADAAALAGADTAVGIVPGVPCENAGRTASANGAELTTCRVDGLIVTVSVRRASGPLAATAAATAGPPPAAR